MDRFWLLRPAAVAVAVLASGCFGDTTAPRHGATARLSVAPVFQTTASLVVPFDRVRVTLTGTSGVALDTIVAFPSTADSVALKLSVPVTGESETFTLDLALINATGDTVFRGGPLPVTATAGVTTTPPGVAVALRYVGVGSNARSVKITPHTAAAFFGDSVILTAAALDSAGQPIPGTPVEWLSLDTALARLRSDSSGKVIGGTTRGAARIEARLLTQQADTAQITVEPLPAALKIVSGTSQSAVVGTALSQAVVLRVIGPDSLGEQGVPVTLTVASGSVPGAGGAPVTTATDTTNATGDVSTTWTLGDTAGVQTLTATVVGAPSLTAAVAATALAGPARRLVFSTEPPASGTAGVGFGAVVTAKDSLGNTAAAFADSVTVAITAGTGKAGAALRGVAKVVASSGVASFAGLSVDSAGTGYTLTASSGVLPGATSTPFAVAPGPAVALAFSAQPPASAIYQSPFGVTVTARDSLGNTATSFGGSVTLALATDTVGGTLSGTLTRTASSGVAAFSGLSIDNIGSYTLSAAATGVSAGTSSAFSIVAPLGWDAWINRAGGNWSLGTNWSKGTAPAATDSVAIKQSGNYRVTLDVSAAPPNLQAGAPFGAETLSVATTTLTATRAAFGPTATLVVSGAVAPGVLAIRTGAAVTIAGPFDLLGGSVADSGQMTVTGLTTWNGGALNVLGAGSAIRLTGGSGTSFTGTGTVTAGDTLALSGGTFTLTGNLSVSGGGPLLVSGGTFSLNGHAAGLAGDLVTSGTGGVQMTNAADSLDVAGNATFGGALGTMNAGVIRLAGNFSQAGTGNFQGQAQSASVAHRVVLTGSTNTTVSFADPATSYFRRLIMQKGAGSGVTLLTDARTTFYSNQTGTTTLVGAKVPLIPRFIVDTLSGLTGNLAMPLVIELGGIISDSGSVTADTVVFTGANQIIRTVGTGGLGTITYNSIRVAQASGTATLGSSFTLPNDLVVSSGGFDLGKLPLAVKGNFRTEGTGVLVMNAPTDSLGVAGNVTFGGGTTGALATGIITAGGNFTEIGSGSVFASTGTRVRLGRATAGVQTIQLADTANSYFYDLVLDRTTLDTVRLLSTVLATDSVVEADSTVLASTGLEAIELPATGVLRVHSRAFLLPSRAEFGTLVADSTFLGGPARIMPDTAVFLNGGSISSGTGFGWKSVRVAGGTLTSGGTNLSGNLIVSGAGRYAASGFGATDSIAGFLRIEGSGTFQMALIQAPPTVVVTDSAVFGGGSESGLLTSGTLRLKGSFVQRGPTATSFVATSGHTTTFAGSGPQTVAFANPGASASTFGNLAIERTLSAVSQSAGIQLGSNVFVAGNLTDSTFNTAVVDSIAGNGFTVTAGGLSLGSQFVMNNAPLVTSSTSLFLSGLTFRNMSPTVTQWTMSGLVSTSPITLSGLNFVNAPGTGGLYFAASSASSAILSLSGLPKTLPAGTYSLTNVTATWNTNPL